MICPSFDATRIDSFQVGICPDIDLKLSEINFVSRLGFSASSASGEVARDKGVDSVSEIQNAPFQRVGNLVDLQNVGTNRSLYCESEGCEALENVSEALNFTSPYHNERVRAVKSAN